MLPDRKLERMGPQRELKTPTCPLDPILGLLFSLARLPVGLIWSRGQASHRTSQNCNSTRKNLHFKNSNPEGPSVLCLFLQPPPRRSNRSDPENLRGWAAGRKDTSQRRWGGREAARQREARGLIN